MNTTDSAPAGGAAIGQVIGASAAAMAATAILLYLGWAHRTGRNDVLRRISTFAARDTGFAPWAALPSLLAAGSLLVALLGMYWDISLHIDDGRDPGPLANPAHYLILVGLFGIFSAGFLAIVLPEGKPSPRALRIAGDWYAPLGGVAMLAAAGFALIGFPLDDVWHRIFGQDVTLWGPTHLMLIGGAGLTLIGSCVLIVEGTASQGEPAYDGLGGRALNFMARQRKAWAMGGLLIGLSTFQGEFDFGVPQFQLVLEPILLAFAAGTALTAARIWIGPGAAIRAALFFVVVRGTIALIVGPVLGETTPHLPLYLAEAACVELVALTIGTARPYRFAALCGVLIGTIGFAAEYAWSQIWMPVPWPSELISEALPVTLIAAIAASLLGAYLGGALTAARNPRSGAMPALAPAIAAAVALVAVVAINIPNDDPRGWSADVTLDRVNSGPNEMAQATVRIDPEAVTENPYWIQAISWQGGAPLHLEELERVEPGVYRTTEPVPVYGTWKTLIRLHRDDTLAGVPIYMPADSAIPAPAVPAKPQFERPFTDEKQILQREQKDDVPGYLATIAYSVVGSIVLALIALLAWVLRRLGTVGPEPRRPQSSEQRPPISRREVTA